MCGSYTGLCVFLGVRITHRSNLFCYALGSTVLTELNDLLLKGAAGQESS